jgi:nucleoside-diphosphate-sugar epimerase
MSPRLNICMIGGSGFVSGTLVRIARDAGHNVWIVTRGERQLPREDVHAIKVDRNDRSRFAKLIENVDRRFDLVVDCIGYVEDDARQDIAVFRGRCHHFVFISTDFVFDPLRRRFPARADHSCFETQRDYGRQKRQCELQFMTSDTSDMAWTIVRPCHVYGPGLSLGCLPMHSRDVDLIEKMQNGDPLRLVGGGHFLQQPILAEDLARTILSCCGNSRAAGKIYMTAGPDIIESHQYYRLIGDVLGIKVTIEEVPVASYAQEHPEHVPFLCHRIYDLRPMQDDGLVVPSTPIVEGIMQATLGLLT